MSTRTTSSPANPVAHRRFIDDYELLRPFQGAALFQHIGGQATVDRLVDGLYDRIERDEELRPLFSSDLTQERARQKLFFAQWLGAGPRYEDVAYASLKHKHDALVITRDLAGRWLGHFRRSLDEAVSNEPERRAIFAGAETFAFALVNDASRETSADRSGARKYLSRDSTRPATCGLGSPEHPRNRAAELARRGDVRGLTALLEAEPATLRLATHAAVVLQAAVLAGKLESVAWLVQHGVSVDGPAPAGDRPELACFITPLCAARWKRRAPIEQLLASKGARDDVFTAAFLGRVEPLRAALDGDPGLAQVIDPAGDILDVTPIHHALLAGQLDALRVLLEHVDGPLVGGANALRAAVARESVPMVELLLAHRADVTRLGAGRWVLHPALAPLLARAGARVDSSGDWIRLSCTGNQGRKDDPEYVRALLEHGARADDRRRLGVTASGATALHYAAKAGFLKTIQVLLEHGADPNAVDDEGQTPLDWLARASKSVDRARVKKLLRR